MASCLCISSTLTDGKTVFAIIGQRGSEHCFWSSEDSSVLVWSPLCPADHQPLVSIFGPKTVVSILVAAS